MATFNLSDIFENQFGYRNDGEDIEVDESELVNVKSADKWYRKAPNDPYDKTIFMPVVLEGLFLPYCWITVLGESKKIIQTNFTERRGKSKTYISSDDVNINLRGFFFTRDGTFPEDDVVAFESLMRKNVALEMDCPLTDIFLLKNDNGAQDKVVVKNWRLLDNKGTEHVKGFEISLVSDYEFELELR